MKGGKDEGKYSDDDSASSVYTEDANDNAGLEVLDDGQEDQPLLPVAGFGSCRYGMLGVFDRELSQADPKDSCERWCPTFRYVHGYQGRRVHSMFAGESHVALLLDHNGEEGSGGKLFTHGMANGGRLGIGPARVVKKTLLGRMRVKGKRRLSEAEEEEYSLEPDFSQLEKEPDPDDLRKEDTRFQPVPTKVPLLEKISNFSVGQSHGACITSGGELYTWGIARHGRLGIGEAATNSSLPFDELDANDTYVPRPALVEIKGIKVAMVSCGHKHTLACDEYGACYSWGCARYGRLGLGSFDHLPREHPDINGDQDPYSWHVLTPQKIASFGTVTVNEVFAGGYNSFALNRVGNRPSLVFAWGLARYGLLGVGESPSACCWQERFNTGVPADECGECKKQLDTFKSRENKVYLEGRIGHTPFSRIRVSEPAELQKDVLLQSDPEDAFDKYLSYPVEVPAMASLNISKIYCGVFHHLAVSKSGQIYSWGLLRHGRCGMGKFDPDSQLNVRAGRVIFDRSVKAFPREDRFDVDFKGNIKISVHDNLSWFNPLPTLVVGLQGKKICHASAGELHSAAVTDDGRLFTWGCARHGRLGTKDAWDSLLLDSKDPDGRYRAVPAEVPGFTVSLVACSSCSTLVVGKAGEMSPAWLEKQIQEAKKKKGLFSALFATAGAKRGSKITNEAMPETGSVPTKDMEADLDEERKGNGKCHVM